MQAWPLIDAALVGPLRRSPGRNALLVVAIALGVALGFAIYLINRSAADEVSLAARSLYGLADLAIESAAGLDENLYPRIAAVPGVAVASPVVEVEGKLADRRGSLTLLGVDAFRSRQLQSSLAALAGTMSSSAAAFDPQAVFLSASAARELKRDTGDVLEIQVGEQTQQLRVAGVLPQAGLEDRAGVMDIAAAQWKFGRLGKLSRINVRLASGARAERVRADIAALLPPDARVTTPGEASNEALRLSRAYRSNLTALALVALFTGGFFVYSTQSLATLRRRREFAVLHALGVTRGQQLALVLAGSAIIGTCGAVLGVMLGLVAARVGLDAIGGDLGAGYFRGLAAELEVRGWEVAAFCVLGVLVAIIGALRPAIEAARVPTAAALKAGDVTSRRASHAWSPGRGTVIARRRGVAAAADRRPAVAGFRRNRAVDDRRRHRHAFDRPHSAASRAVRTRDSVSGRDRADRRHGALCNAQRVGDSRELQSHGVDGDHGDLVPHFARPMDAAHPARRRVRASGVCRPVGASRCAHGAAYRPSAGRRAFRNRSLRPRTTRAEFTAAGADRAQRGSHADCEHAVDDRHRRIAVAHRRCAGLGQ